MVRADPGGPQGALALSDVQRFAGNFDMATGIVEVRANPATITTKSEDGLQVWVHGRLQGGTAETVLDSYRRSGVSAVEGLRGPAALAILDGPRRQLHLIRHPGTEITIYYRHEGDNVSWSTHPADLSARPSDTFDTDYALLYLRSGAILSPGSMVGELKRVPPNEARTFAPGGVSASIVWTPVWGRSSSEVPMDERTAELEAIIACSFDELRPALIENPAILLSGGIDSAGLAAGLVRWDPEVDLTAYTLTFDGDVGEMDEFEEANAVARHLGLRHEPILFTPQLIADHLDWMVTAYGEPFGYGLHTSFLGPLADAGHRLVLGGTGPDAFYPEGSQRKWQRMSDAIPLSLHGAVARIAHAFGDFKGARGMAKAFDITAKPLPTRIPTAAGPTSNPDTLSMLGVPAERLDVAAESGAAYVSRRLALLEGMSRAELGAYSWSHLIFPDQGAEWMHRWATTYGMESALPLYDNRVANYLMRLPDLAPDRGEFRELALRSLPRELAYNRKIGQTLPLAEWLRGPLLPLARERLAEAGILEGIVDPDGARAILDQHVSGQENHHWLIWKLMALITWKSGFDARRNLALSEMRATG